MLRKIALSIGVAACGAMVASCGGGNNSPTPSPTPTPTTTGTPTPTPTATPVVVDFDFTKAFTATISNALYSFAYFTPNAGGTEVFSDASRLTGSSTITYAVSPEKVTYAYADLTAAVEFLGTELVGSSATERTYQDGDEKLILELPYGEVLRVSYERKDPFTRDTVPGVLRSRRVALFFNPVTTTSAISGTLSYTGTPHVVGGKKGETPSNAVSAPERTFTVSGASPAVSGTIPVFETIGGTQTQKALLSFSAPVTSNSFSGDVTNTANGFSGKFAGSLAGPNREEIVLIFSVSHSDGREYVGSFIGT